MRLVSVASAFLLALLVAGPAAALEKRKYDAAAFKDAQSSNKSILVDISATWCPTCKAQHKVLDLLAKRPEFAEIVVFEVDFDSQKDAVKSFNARQQSTLIAFNGAQETRRLVGETGTESIQGLLKSTSRSERLLVSLASIGLAALAGILSTLSPCVLPLYRWYWAQRSANIVMVRWRSPPYWPFRLSRSACSSPPSAIRWASTAVISASSAVLC